MRIKISLGYVIVAIVLLAVAFLPASNAAEKGGKAHKPKSTESRKALKKNKISVGNQDDIKVKKHIKKNRTVVESHRRTKPDKRKENNYSTKGNVNPYTGKEGTKTFPSN